MTSRDEREALVKPEYCQYQRKQIAEMADWREGFDMAGVSVSDADKAAGSPKLGDKIARNPKNHADRWLVAADYFADNFAAITAHPSAGEPVAWMVEGTFNGDEVTRTLFNIEDRTHADRFMDNNGGVIVPLVRAAHPVNGQGDVSNAYEECARICDELSRRFGGDLHSAGLDYAHMAAKRIRAIPAAPMTAASGIDETTTEKEK